MPEQLNSRKLVWSLNKCDRYRDSSSNREGDFKPLQQVKGSPVIPETSVDQSLVSGQTKITQDQIEISTTNTYIDGN